MRQFFYTGLIFCAVACTWAPPMSHADSGAIGSSVTGFTLEDCQGNSRDFNALQGTAGTAIVFLGVECPLARLYGRRLCELAERYQGKVALIGIDSNSRDDIGEISKWRETYAPTLMLLHDPNGVVADQLGATRNPEVILLDRDHRIRYRGRIDDQYTTTAKKQNAVRHDLVVAMDELLSGRPIAVPETIATGCYIDRSQLAELNPESVFAYHQHIAPIFRSRCVGCHRPGQSGPFALTTYDQVHSWMDTIEEVIREKRMPPWLASPDHGEFDNDAGLSQSESNSILRWIENGAPEGDSQTAAVLEPLPETEWNIGQPDLVLSIPEPFKVAAEGTIEYQYFVVDTGFTEDRWVAAAEVRPTNPEVVHHCNVWIEKTSVNKFSVESLTSLASGYLAVAAPGRPPMVFRQGMAKRIPAGAKLVFQLHYQSIGSEQVDQTRLGLKFADPLTVKREVSTRGLIANANHLKIPPRVANFPVRLKQQLDHDMLLLALTPHMHLRGRCCRYEAIYPDGRQEILLDIPQWDSNWQDRYVLSQPKRLPSGTVMVAAAVFDNSAGNPFNPDPDQGVEYGPQLTDEMFNAWYEAVLPNQDLTEPAIVQLWKNGPLKKLLFPLAACFAMLICCRFLPAPKHGV